MILPEGLWIILSLLEALGWIILTIIIVLFAYSLLYEFYDRVKHHDSTHAKKKRK